MPKKQEFDEQLQKLKLSMSAPLSNIGWKEVYLH
jgi:hypothetical protein